MRRRVGVLAGCAMMAFASVAPAVAADHRQLPFTSPQGDFIVDFPGDRPPVRSSQSQDGPQAYSAEYFTVDDFGTAYVALRAEADDINAAYANEVEALEDFARGLFLGMSGELESETPFAFRGMYAVEVVGTIDALGDEGAVIARAYISGDVIWGVLVLTAAPAGPTDPDVVAFLDSFDLVKAGF